VTGQREWRLASADPVHLRRASDELDSLLSERGASEFGRFVARLVCEEIVLNAFEHGGAGTVVMEIDAERRLTFVDDGLAFDPTAGSRELADARNADEVRLRVRGLQLLHKFGRSLEYRRQDDRNHLAVLLPE
jgi:anti-sigma regulatory factor (Ser/Thr protein kinase)